MIGSVVLRVAQAFATAALYRLRGGGWVQLGHTQLARLFWVVAAVSNTVIFSTISDPLIIAFVGITAFVAMLNGHGEHHDLGRSTVGGSLDGKPYETFTALFKPLILKSASWSFGKRELFDAAMMTWIGFLRGMITVVPAIIVDNRFAAAYVAGSSLMGLAYWIGYRIPISLPSLTARSTEWGEVMTGLFIVLSLIVATL